MIAGTYNFTYQQGTTLTFLINYKDADDDPINLTDFTARGMIKVSVQDATPTAVFILTIDDGPGGVIRAVLPASSFIGIPLKGKLPSDKNAFVYDIEIENLSGEVTRILQGTINVNPEVTK